MPYDANDPRLTAYLFGELSESERIAFKSALEDDAELRKTLDETRGIVESLRSDLQVPQPLLLTDKQRSQIVREFQARRNDTSRDVTELNVPTSVSTNQPRQRRRLITGMVGTAVLAAGVMLALLFVPPFSTERQLAQQADAPRNDPSHATNPTSDSAYAAVESSSEFSGLLTDQSAPADVKAAATPRRSQRESTANFVGEERTVTGIAPGMLGPGNGTIANVPSAAFSTIPVKPGAMGTRDGSESIAIPDVVVVDGAITTRAKQPNSGQPFNASVVGSAGASMSRGATAVVARDGNGVIPTENYHPGGANLSLGDGSVKFKSQDSKVRQPGKIASFVGEEELVGRSPGQSGDRFDPIVDNPFRHAQQEPLSTFSIDVDTASYAKVRQFLVQANSLPRRDAVRIEELINYFRYDYAGPSDDTPFAAHVEVAACPWTPVHRLVRIGLKGREVPAEKRPVSNLVFLVDVSGSMNQPNKLPLVVRGLQLLTEQLGENDRVGMVVYAGAAGLVLPSTSGDRRQEILGALERLRAGGSTNGGDGIRLAYQTALDYFIPGGVNRVILCTDGDFNVGTTGTDELVRLVQEKAKSGVFLTVLGFGMGNHNDAMLEQVSGKGNGNYAFIDTLAEAKKVLVEQINGTLVTIAKDVKIQVEFNPRHVAAYRLIGYENRMLAAQDFNDDKKDAGEIGAGHTVTALYEIVPVGAASKVAIPPIDELKYQAKSDPSAGVGSGELLTLKLRYKQPQGDTSSLLSVPVRDDGKRFSDASRDFRFAAAVASFGMLLRDSPHRGDATYAGALEIASEAAVGPDSNRAEFLELIRRAEQLTKQ